MPNLANVIPTMDIINNCLTAKVLQLQTIIR